jgi:hypothetical protein
MQLLIRNSYQLGQLLLVHAQYDPPLAQSGSNVMIYVRWLLVANFTIEITCVWHVTTLLWQQCDASHANTIELHPR